MHNNISISLVTPHMTRERYSEVTGLSVKTIDMMLGDGRLSAYRHRLKKDGGRELILINVAALTLDALSGHKAMVSEMEKITRHKTGISS